MSKSVTYEAVIGLEVHAQLLTRSKLFSPEAVQFGEEPNTQVSTISLAHPGTLPKMNRKAIELAVKLGLACNSEIVKENYFARKNYFYPDLPKGYQLTQHTTPICKGGVVTIESGDGKKDIQLNRIHIEEDAGKSIHDVYDDQTALDFNRAGTALLEIVTDPVIRSGEEAYRFLTELRKLVRYLEICDGNMEEGSMRCDANISVRKQGETRLGTKVEIKNLNSIRNVKKAIEAEVSRMTELLVNGKEIHQQTRGFDVSTGNTFTIRDKEESDDYRYFPEPDLSPFHIDDDFIRIVRSSIPRLPAERMEAYKRKYALSDYDSRNLADEKAFSDYFEELCEESGHYKACANWMLGPVKSWLNENNKNITDFPVPPGKLVQLIKLVESGNMSFTAASSRMFDLLIHEPDADPLTLAEANQLLQVSDAEFIEPIVDEVLEKLKDKVMEFRKGKKGLLGLFVGEVMKRSAGKADPEKVNKMILNRIQNINQ